MNNGKAIMETQDSEECIYLLAAQRQLYTESKRWKAAQFGASLAIPFVITLGQVLRVIQIDAAWAVATEALVARRLRPRLRAQGMRPRQGEGAQLPPLLGKKTPERPVKGLR